MIPSDLILTSIFYVGPYRKPFENLDIGHVTPKLMRLETSASELLMSRLSLKT